MIVILIIFNTLTFIAVSCDGSTDIMSTNETELVVTQLSSNTICSARVRALVEVGIAVAYSPYTDSVTFTTRKLCLLKMALNCLWNYVFKLR